MNWILNITSSTPVDRDPIKFMYRFCNGTKKEPPGGSSSKFNINDEDQDFGLSHGNG